MDVYKNDDSLEQTFKNEMQEIVEYLQKIVDKTDRYLTIRFSNNQAEITGFTERYDKGEKSYFKTVNGCLNKNSLGEWSFNTYVKEMEGIKVD